MIAWYNELTRERNAERGIAFERTMAVRKAEIKFTLIDYLNLPEYPRYELIEGDLLLTPSPSTRHQRAAGNVEAVLRAWVERNNLGTVFDAPLDVVLSDETVVQPDVMVILNDNRHVIQERIEGPPNLIVEILSPATKDRDLTTKRRLYARHGVKEYWTIDVDRRTIEVNTWTPTGYVVHGTYAYADTVVSPLLPGFSAPVKEIVEG